MKRIMTVLLISILSLSLLIGCGKSMDEKNEIETEQQTENPTNTPIITEKPVQTPEPTLEPTVEIPDNPSSEISNVEPDPIKEKEPLISDSYIKEATIDDVVFDEESGFSYVKNQLMVMAVLGTPKEAMEQLAEEIGADIVGYIGVVEDYQFEFRKDMSYQELTDMITYLEGIPYVDFAELNFVFEIDFDV